MFNPFDYFSNTEFVLNFDQSNQYSTPWSTQPGTVDGISFVPTVLFPGTLQMDYSNPSAFPTPMMSAVYPNAMSTEYQQYQAHSMNWSPQSMPNEQIQTSPSIQSMPNDVHYPSPCSSGYGSISPSDSFGTECSHSGSAKNSIIYSPISRPIFSPAPFTGVVAPNDQTPVNPRRGRKRKNNELLNEKKFCAFQQFKTCENAFARKVPGRLNIIGITHMYDVSDAEVLRRVIGPEKMNKNSLQSLLKIAKIANYASELKERVRELGHNLSTSSTSQAPITTFSALTESEGLRLTSEHRQLIDSYFPTSSLVQVLVRECNIPSAIGTLRRNATNARIVMEQLKMIAEEWSIGEIEGTSSRNSSLRRFSLFTHYIGVEEWKTFSGLLLRIFEAIETECETLYTMFSQLDLSLDLFPQNYTSPELPEKSVSNDVHTTETTDNVVLVVNSRLSLDSRKHPIRVSEVIRRLREPETLNVSTLSSMLRVSKVKNACDEIRSKLKEHGITVANGQRIGAPISVFTALLEVEAVTMANDMNEMISKYFPVDKLIRTLQLRLDRNQMPILLDSLHVLTSSIIDFLESSRMSVLDRSSTVCHPYSHIMDDYSLITHGFGPNEAINWFGMFKKMCGLFDLFAL